MLYRAVNVIEMKHSRAEIRSQYITLVLTQVRHDGPVIVMVMAGVGVGVERMVIALT